MKPATSAWTRLMLVLTMAALLLPAGLASNAQEINPAAKQEEETAGNNLSFPVVWSDGVAKTLRGTFGVVQFDGASAEFDGQTWYLQNDELNEWQAASADWKASPPSGYEDGVDVDWVDWGDNLEAKSWPASSNQVRVETVLYQDLTTAMLGYTMANVNPDVSGPSEVWGTNTETYDSTQATVYSACARLTIQKLNTTPATATLEWDATTGQWTGTDAEEAVINKTVWQTVDGPGNYAAEINAPGKVIYGYNWPVANTVATEGQGYYRITFSLDGVNCPTELNTFFQTTQILQPVEEEGEASAAAEETGGGGVAQIDTANNLSYIDVLIGTYSGTEPTPTPTPTTTPSDGTGGFGRQGWHFAEGYTAPEFDEYLTLLNANSTAADVSITYFLSDGTTITKSLTMAPASRFTVAVHDSTYGVGRDHAVSAKVTTTHPGGIIAERPMYFTYKGTLTGGHDVMGAIEPHDTWYFAEGYTADGFDEYLTIMNPNNTAADVSITYFLNDGSTQVKDLTVGPTSRYTVAVHDALEGVGRNQEVSARVTTTNPGGIVVERPMYFTYNGTVTGGHNALGAPAPDDAWYFAEGYTATGFDEYLTILNPNSTAAPVSITYFLSDGSTQVKDLTVGPTSRFTVAVHGSTYGVGRDREVSARVTTTNPGGIVVERPMYFTYGANVTDGHNVLGAPAPADTWYFAEGYTATGFDEYLTILNPNGAAGTATITYYVEGSSTPEVRSVPLPANSRTTVNVHDPASAGNPGGLGRLSAGHATGVEADVPVVVERPMYFTYGAGITGGHNVLGYTP